MLFIEAIEENNMKSESTTATPHNLRFLKSPEVAISDKSGDEPKSGVLYHNECRELAQKIGANEIKVANLWKSNRKSRKESVDDSACIVYHDGYPTLIASDGGYGCDAKTVRKITTEIIPAILTDNNYVSQLSNAESNAERRKILETILRKINEVVSNQFDHGTSLFVFSIAISFYDKSTQQTRVAGFGTGDVTVAIQENNKYSILKPAQRIVESDSPYMRYLQTASESNSPVRIPPPHYKQFFPAETRATTKSTIDDIASEIHYFDRPISAGIQLCAFTDGVLELLPFTIKRTDLGNNRTMLDIIPDVKALPSTTDEIMSACQRNRDANFENLSSLQDNDYQREFIQANGIINFNPQLASDGGDDAIVAVSTIPTNEQRNALLAHKTPDMRAKDTFLKSFKVSFGSYWKTVDSKSVTLQMIIGHAINGHTIKRSGFFSLFGDKIYTGASTKKWFAEKNITLPSKKDWDAALDKYSLVEKVANKIVSSAQPVPAAAPGSTH